MGASAALAAIDRRRRLERRHGRPRGLAAFESAPCYRELLDRDRELLDRDRELLDRDRELLDRDSDT